MRSVPRRLYYCDHHVLPLPAGHKFPAEKYALVRAALARDGFFEFVPAPLADRATIELAHDPDYVAAVFAGTLDARAMRRIGFPWSEQLVRRTLASVGGTLAAAEDALAHGFGGNLAGGTHHAFRTEGAGFCVFNDLAIATLWLRSRGIERTAIIDLDVHQGDGTASIFDGDASVLTLSLHGENNFPFRKQRSRIDVALSDGTTDSDYLDALRSALLGIGDFRTQFVLYQSGVDALAGDRLGRLSLTLAGLAERDRLVFEFTKAIGVPILITLGGGYSNPILLTAEAHANTFRAAARAFPDSATPRPTVTSYGV